MCVLNINHLVPRHFPNTTWKLYDYQCPGRRIYYDFPQACQPRVAANYLKAACWSSGAKLISDDVFKKSK